MSYGFTSHSGCNSKKYRLDYIYHMLDLEPHLPSSSLRPLRILDMWVLTATIRLGNADTPLQIEGQEPPLFTLFYWLDSGLILVLLQQVDCTLIRSSTGANYCQRSTKIPTAMPRQPLRRIIYLRLQFPYWNHLHLIQSSFHCCKARANVRSGTSQYVILPFSPPHRKCCKAWN